MKHKLAAAVAAFLVTLGPVTTLAGPKAPPEEDAVAIAEARAHFRLGLGYYKEARYREAIAEFQTAYRIKPSAVLHYNIGQAYEKLGDIPAALNSYNEYLHEDPKAANRVTVQRAMANLQGRLAASGVQMLYVTSDPTDAEVWVDGQMRGRSPFNAALAQGHHVVSVAKAGFRTLTRDVTLSPERALEMSLTLQLGSVEVAPAPEEAPPAAPLEARPPAPPIATPANRPPARAERRSWLGPIIAGSAAVVAAGAGAWMGVQAHNAQNSLLHGYPSSSSAADSLAQKARNDATAANVLYGVAGAAALTGGGLIVFGGYF